MEHATNDDPALRTERLDVSDPTYCRAVLQYFRSHPTEVATVDDLVAFVRDADQPDADETGIAIHLHHAALPRLADAGLVDYDARSNTARCRALPRERGNVPTLQCENCGEKQETSLLGDQGKPCENCGGRALSRVDE